MIPERAGVVVDSTVKGEDVAMSIDQSALAHIMNVLTDLYADAELAVIREYATNALDSHIEAGQSRPIEVTTPTALRPLLSIRDFGVGLDAEAIRDIYSRYGASTKRGTNDAVGMLGLGCKSALAYVDQFTLAGIKDGQRMLVSIARDENGAGTMTVLEAGPTDEPDGVEISIPTDDEYTLEQKAKDFFSYWEAGTVLLNGEPPHELSGYTVGDYTVAERNTAWNAEGRHDGNPLTVVMGQVSYPAPDGYTHGALESLPRDRRLVLRVPIGAVHFTPSREGLQDSERTRKALDAALEDFQVQTAAAVVEAVTQAPDKPSAARALIEARQAFGKKIVPELEFEGEEIPVLLSAEDLDPIIEDEGKKERAAGLYMSKIGNGYRGATSYRAPAGQVSLDDAAKNPWILNYTNAKWTAAQRRKLERYLEHHDLHDEPSKAGVYITDAKAVPRPEWIGGSVTAINWKDVREWKDPTTASEGGTGGVTYAGTYPVIYDGHYTKEKYPASELAELSQRKLFYVIGPKWCAEADRVADILGKGNCVVSLSPTRAKKFMRTFPNAREGIAVARKIVESKMRKLSTVEKAALVMSEEYAFSIPSILAYVDYSKIDDPKLKFAAEVAQCRELDRPQTVKSDWFCGVALRPKAEDVGLDDVKATLQNYALLSNIRIYDARSLADHILKYVNAVHAANEGS